MVLLGYGSKNYRLMVCERVEWMLCHYDRKHFYQRLLPAMHHFLSLSNKEYVIVSTVITVHVVGEVGRD